ncbi:MAG TPA: hypothetical protein VKC90_00610 [Chitinophagaceae bacterium]|nr:hypothetical protein [Chitinophagaceae bacterium]
MKLAPLLAQYLYTNKRLNLPGIGSFFLDSSLIIEDENNKHNKAGNIQGISFENNPSIKDTKDLIDFISSQTGKMKALATADLDSYLELAQQFLNIGKPFLVEGIGSLVKIKSGQFAFTSGDIMPDKLKEYSAREISSTASTEESFADYKKNSVTNKGKAGWRKPVALLLLLAGIGLAIWGGYTMYKKTTGEEENFSAVSDKNQPAEIVQVTDTIIPATNDSIPITKTNLPVVTDTATKAIQSIHQGNYKFVIEVANKKRAFYRYEMLKKARVSIQISTADSITFKLFFVLPATVMDTARIIDSLTIWYPALNKRRAFVEL